MILALAALIIGLTVGLEIGARRLRRVSPEIHIHAPVDADAVRRELRKQARRNSTKRGNGYGFQ